MRLRYDTLLSLRIAHAYYGGVCPDFDIVLPAETLRTLRGGRLLAKVLGGVLYVLFEADEGGAPVVSAAGAGLRIGLRLVNPYFSNYTAVPAELAAGTAWYRNGDAPGQLDAPEGRALVGAVFSRALARAERPVTVTLKDSDGQALRAETVTAANDRDDVSFDATGADPGPCSVEEDYGDGSPLTARCYIHPELQQTGVFAIVDLEIHASFYASAPAFEITFDARQDTLRYYLVVSNYSIADFEQLTVADLGADDEGRPEVTFTRVAAAAFTPGELPAALLATGDSRLVLFRSQVPVARRQRAMKKIQLSRNGDVLVEHLPQPGADQADAHLIIHVSR
ncbi:hypothetical protein [Sorangium sp. So ce131]|uniref:hypothetical protein n=1 Tax=Sorangium sp. So ce131 TaxID=3133282 RepID=UPI003F5EA810